MPLNRKTPWSDNPVRPHREERQFGISDPIVGGPAVPKVVNFESVIPFIYKLIGFDIGLLLAEKSWRKKLSQSLTNLCNRNLHRYPREPRVIVTALEIQ